jgi:hypothetical protein
VETVTVEGREGRSASFTGELVVPPVSTYSDDKARWAEFKLYRKEGGGYVVWRAGKSLVYHLKDTGCETRDGRQKGFEKLVRELDKDAEPCIECKPGWPDDLPPDMTVRMEEDRHTISHCATPVEVVHSLTWDPRGKRQMWTDPVSELLANVTSAGEPGFAEISQSPTIRL